MQETRTRESVLAELLDEEIDLRNHAERVAKLRRILPPGPAVQDYAFHDTQGQTVRLSELFDDRSQLLLYHYMFAPDDEVACKMCTMWCDGFDAVEPHVNDVVPFVLVAKAPHEKLAAWAKGRGWRNIRLLSSCGTSFNPDMGAEDAQGDQRPRLSVFTKDADGTVRHFYQKRADLTEEVYRGLDLFSPVWNLLDVLPSGRDDWYPSITYR